MKTDWGDVARNQVTSRVGKVERALSRASEEIAALVLDFWPQKLGEEISAAWSHL